MPGWHQVWDSAETQGHRQSYRRDRVAVLTVMRRLLLGRLVA